MQDVLTDAYQLNREIAAQRAAVRGKDELVPQAKANLWRPHVTINGNVTRSRIEDTVTADLGLRGKQSQNQTRRVDDGLAQLQLAITMYDGGRTPAEIAYAKALIEVERGVLNNTEQKVFLSAAQAYGQIVLARLLQDLATEQIADVKRFRDEAHRVLKLHLVTVADVAQLDAQLVSAQADFEQAGGGVRAARAQLEATVGRTIGDIAKWPSLPLVPASLGEAEAILLAENPQLAAARSQVSANKASVDSAKSAPLPVLSLVSGISKELNNTHYLQPPSVTALQNESFFGALPNTATIRPLTGTIGVQLTWPLYQGGGEYAVIRQRLQGVQQATDTLEDTRRTLVGSLRSAWEDLTAANARVPLTNEQVKSSRIALDGIEHQFHQGTATITDIIVLRQRLNEATAAADRAQYDAFFATLQVLTAIGRFNAKTLRLPVTLYEPSEHYRDVKDKWFGIRSPN